MNHATVTHFFTAFSVLSTNRGSIQWPLTTTSPGGSIGVGAHSRETALDIPVGKVGGQDQAFVVPLFRTYC